jgi:transposase InsO family protein
MCGRSRGNQLTREEQRVLRKIALSKKYAHMSVKSLQMYCIRKNLLCCSVDSWYKYINLFNIDRNTLCKKVKKRYGLGVRANRPNQLWHVDVTYIKLLGGKTVYLQAIIDNFSRYVVSWRLSESIGADSSIETIRKALKKNSAGSLMMDGGTENTNRKVEKVLLHNNIKRIISKEDVRWSNSIVEALFRSLKNNFLYFKISKTIDELKRKINFYFKQHNNVIPHSSFDGAVPCEMYQEKWNQEKENNFAARIQFSLAQRIFENRRLSCCLSS